MAATLVTTVVFAGCSDSYSPTGNDSTDPSGAVPTATIADELVSPEEVVATAVNAYAQQFGRKVRPADILVVTGSRDSGTISQLLADSKSVVRLEPATGAYWRVLGVKQVDGHWEIEIESVDGMDYFAGTIVVVKTEAGQLKQVEPEEVGVTLVTSVS